MMMMMMMMMMTTKSKREAVAWEKKTAKLLFQAAALFVAVPVVIVAVPVVIGAAVRFRPELLLDDLLHVSIFDDAISTKSGQLL